MEPYQDILNRIGRVNPPEDLYEQIEERLLQQEAERMPPLWTLAASLILAVSVTLSVYLMTTQVGTPPGQVEGLSGLAEGMGLVPSNQFYYE